MAYWAFDLSQVSGLINWQNRIVFLYACTSNEALQQRLLVYLIRRCDHNFVFFLPFSMSKTRNTCTNQVISERYGIMQCHIFQHASPIPPPPPPKASSPLLRSLLSLSLSSSHRATNQAISVSNFLWLSTSIPSVFFSLALKKPIKAISSLEISQVLFRSLNVNELFKRLLCCLCLLNLGQKE